MKTLTDTILSLLTNEIVWIRDIALAVEETMPDATMDQIHAGLAQLQSEGAVVMFPGDDPAQQGYRKALPFAWTHPTGVTRMKVSLSSR